jgi:phosphoglycolate phosphatase
VDRAASAAITDNFKMLKRCGSEDALASSGIEVERIRLILFDLDGTLVDSVGDLSWCGNEMLHRLGLPRHDAEAAQNWVGNGLERFVKRVLTADMDAEPEVQLYQQGLEIFRELYGAHASDRSELYPGAIETLQHLSQRDLKLVCVTNKPEPFTSQLIVAMGLDIYFDLVVAGNTTARKKPDAMPLHYAADHFGFEYDQCLMVGDSSNDVLAARAAGFAIVCVPYGYNHGLDIRDSNPDLVVETLTGLSGLFS